jgi:outer membrane receptor for ferrienterochelin and colicin
MRREWLIGLLMILLVSSLAAAQGNPTGAISGQVVDPDHLSLPGVTVTASSPVLQGTRVAVTSANGDYIIPFLPPGDYTVTFELQGFGVLKQTARVEIGATVPVNATMKVAGVSETVTVTGTATEIAQTATVASTYKSDVVERLPMGRTLNAYTLLAPGVNDNGPAGNIMMSGALSYENLNLVNGVVINENLRGQSRNLFIEDAIQESKVSTGSISAEYGRFQGGVVNTITKSGGNVFSGSFRTSFTNDAWQALTPFPGDQNIDKIVPTYEGTVGGPIFMDKLWFFAAGRYENLKQNMTAEYTAYNYVQQDKETRYEGKLTYALNPKNSARFSYIKRRLDTVNNHYASASAVMDQRSLYDNAQDEKLISANYTSVISSNFFLEGQYSKRELAMIGTGSQLTDIAGGTPIWDRSRGQARFNSPTFCAVCGSGIELRNNWDAFVKANYFLSTKALGSHSLVAGVDVYKEMRKNDNYQSGSSFRVQASGAGIIGTGSANPVIYPIFKNDNTTYIDYLPLVATTKGNDIRTYSVFLNDAWRLNDRLSFNIGVRYDRNNSKDQGGSAVVKDANYSPRLGATWDVMGDGKWKANAGFARYVMGISTAIVDAGSVGGRTATYSYFYKGPQSVNVGCSEAAQANCTMTADKALPILFDWFFAANGRQDGIPGKLTTRTTPNVPGTTTRVGKNLKSPNSDEYSIGLAREIGQQGAVRVDYVYRNYRDFYGDFRDMSTGRVYEPVSAKYYDLVEVRNTNSTQRDYKGVSTQFSYRLRRDLSMGANYTLSWARGNFEGETATDGPVRANANDMPEYRDEKWNFPVGYTNGDQRHKARVWGSFDLPTGDTIGRMTVGLMQRVDSGRGYDWSATIDSRPYVTNPGYVTPTSSVTYFFSDRGGMRRPTAWRTDFSFNWEARLPAVPRGRVFLRAIVNNLFNNTKLVGFNTTVQTKAQNSSLAAFNPFTSTPVQGVNWVFGPEYGNPTDPNDYQSTREFSFSVGVRF